MKPWVIVDVSYLAYRAKHALGDLAHEDYPTGVIFGLLEQLKTICTDPMVQSNKLLLCFDSRKSYRKLKYPWYKSKRHADLTEVERQQLKVMHDQIRVLWEELPKIGFMVARQTGCESDDMMAMAAQGFSGSERQAILITADGDLYQCITDAVHWYDPARRAYYDPSTFLRKKGLEPGWWGDVKAIGGCPGDGVPGVDGCGEKSAIQYILHTLPVHHMRYKAITSVEGVWIADRNRELVVLPHKRTKVTLSLPTITPEYDTEAFFQFCEKHGLKSYLKEPKKSEWVGFLRGQQIHTRRPTRGQGTRQGFRI